LENDKIAPSAAPQLTPQRTIGLVGLTVAAAFLLRFALAREFLSRIEIAALTAAGVPILIYPYVKAQVGLAAVVIVMVLIVHRAVADARPAAAVTR